MNAREELLQPIAARLALAEERREPCVPIRDAVTAAGGTRSLAETAYAVQRFNVERRIGQGERIVGRKIGLTSVAVQRQLGVDAPDFGTLFASMAIADNQAVSLSRLIQPKVEAEIALVLGRDLHFQRHTVADLVSATAYALPAIEIVDSRIADWNIRLADTIADNASSAMFVLGTRPVALAALNLSECGMSLSEDGQEVSSGSGAACLGNPLNAAVWLADTMARLGTPLRAGDVLMTGALGAMVKVRAGRRYAASIEGLGGVSVAFDLNTAE